MSKIRIYSLARELGLDNQVVLSALDELGVAYKSHSSSIDEEHAEAVRQHLVGGRPKTASSRVRPRTRSAAEVAQREREKAEQQAPSPLTSGPTPSHSSIPGVWAARPSLVAAPRLAPLADPPAVEALAPSPAPPSADPALSVTAEVIATPAPTVDPPSALPLERDSPPAEPEPVVEAVVGEASPEAQRLEPPRGVPTIPTYRQPPPPRGMPPVRRTRRRRRPHSVASPVVVEEPERLEPEPPPNFDFEPEGSETVRAPVVTVMGHVDHGKTSLLDAIRNTRVASGEAGGITQHIGAYEVTTPHGRIVFIDTPGHEAFTAIRQRGAQVTDIAVIVVAADDGIMSQTREAIAHARAADVPIIVAINKIDLPNANAERVKQALMQENLVPEEFGGDTVVVPISAKTQEGLPKLLEMIHLVAELEELTARQQGPARGVVIESVLDRRAGPLVTLLVQRGVLKHGDCLVVGAEYGKIRAMTNSFGDRLKEAGPSTPVQILGFSSLPEAGAQVRAVEGEKTAKEQTEALKSWRARRQLTVEPVAELTLNEVFGERVNQKDVSLVLRTDTYGSLEALKGILHAESTEEVKVRILFEGVGSITEADVLLASTANAQILAFNSPPAANVVKAAERMKVTIKNYRIIYELIDEVQRMIKGQVEPVFREELLGHAEVRMIISIPRLGNVAGSYVTDGKIVRGAKVRLSRGGREVYKGSIAQLKRFKDDVREVAQGYECGINLANYNAVEEGDIIEAYQVVEVPS